MNNLKLAKYKRQGGVLLELVIIIPFILFLSFTGFELIRSLKYLNLAATLSREIANIAYRECDPNNTNMQTCLDTYRQNLETYAITNLNLDGIEIKVTYVSANSVDAWNGNFIKSPDDATGYKHGNSDDGPTNFIKEYSKIAYLQKGFLGECYIPYTPIVSYVDSFFPFPLQEGAIYDATFL